MISYFFIGSIVVTKIGASRIYSNNIKQYKRLLPDNCLLCYLK
jgi:hypothetical protein